MKVEPRILPGFMELLPNEQVLFNNVKDIIKNNFEKFGFLPVDSPAIESSQVLLAKAGGETEKQIYRFNKGENDLCLRYDLTVPLARFVAAHYNELNFPFRRYQINKVYRGERPQKGRFREFYHCDADIIGNGELSVVADAECVRLFEKCFEALNLEVEIEVSNRKILSGFIEDIGKTDRIIDILIVLDKLAKIPFEEAMAQLSEIGLTTEECKKIINLTKNHGKIEEIMQNLCNFCKNELFQTGLKELQETDKYLKLMGAKNIVYNLSIIRGHNYYTGTVFEAFLKNSSYKNAVGGGGRYENLCSYFSTTKMPGVGMSIGITRLFDVLLKENYFNLENNEIDCAIVTFDETFDAGLEIMTKLRQQGIRAESFYENKSFKSKMKEANRRQVKFVIIVGEDEINSGLYTLKNMQDSSQTQLSLDAIVEKIKSDRMASVTLLNN